VFVENEENPHMKNYHINRRLFLRGLGGAAVAAPFLASLAERSARAAGDELVMPKRLIVMFTHYGCMTDRWFPEKAHGELAASDFTGMSIEPLAPFASKILMPRGLRSMNEWTAQMNTGQGNDPHTQVVGSYFSCQPVTPNSDSPFDLNHPGKFNAWPIAPTLDHVIAKQLSPGGTPLFMRVGNRSDNGQMAISYSNGTEAGRYQGVGTPKQAFSSLTGLFSGGDTGGEVTPDDYMALRGASVIDLVKSDLETLERMDMSRADKDKLAAWKELLFKTQGPIAAAECSQDIANALGLLTENVDKASGGSLGSDIVTTSITSDLDTADIYSAVATLAAACNANPVIFLKYPGNYRFTGLGCTDENHNISHRIGNAGMGGQCVPGVNEEILLIDTFYARKFAKLVEMLNSIDEGDGKLLDNSATIWFQELSDGNAHNLNNLPIIQAGSCGGYFKTGQAVNLHDGAPTLNRGNSEGPCRDSGKVTATNTGTPGDVGNAPINKYFCNIMNALGVKAGPDGFPAEGGTQEVTHFGWSDDTAEFVHGDKAAAHSIHNPNEYAELRANS